MYLLSISLFLIKLKFGLADTVGTKEFVRFAYISGVSAFYFRKFHMGVRIDFVRLVLFNFSVNCLLLKCPPFRENTGICVWIKGSLNKNSIFLIKKVFTKKLVDLNNTNLVYIHHTFIYLTLRFFVLNE